MFATTLSVSLLSVAAPDIDTSKGDVDVDALLDRVDDVWRGDASHARLSMKVKTEHYERTMEMEAWSKGKNYTLVRIEAPLKERGSATLKAEDTIYTYLPKTDRTIRLTSGMMGGSWMGSHFTNDDLVKESRMRQDYDAEVSFRGERDEREVIELTLTPKPDAAVVWGRVVTVVDAETLNPVKITYYDEDLEVARTAKFGDVGPLGGRTIPRSMTMTPADHPDEFTRIEYEKLDFDVDLEPSFFSVSRLERRR
jgi:outer membrane lipoprotein-sorting protein